MYHINFPEWTTISILSCLCLEFSFNEGKENQKSLLSPIVSHSLTLETIIRNLVDFIF